MTECLDEPVGSPPRNKGVLEVPGDDEGNFGERGGGGPSWAQPGASAKVLALMTSGWARLAGKRPMERARRGGD